MRINKNLIKREKSAKAKELKDLKEALTYGKKKCAAVETEKEDIATNSRRWRRRPTRSTLTSRRSKPTTYEAKITMEQYK